MAGRLSAKRTLLQRHSLRTPSSHRLLHRVCCATGYLHQDVRVQRYTLSRQDRKSLRFLRWKAILQHDILAVDIPKIV